ncbi:hypothetical protein Cgig2_030883 [Carnegiea gigantea]|uniref:Uncharacterized protein n=1 Tax=Carnegiea gigantea TaxID=171969 RepID=A0A9Q1QK53_9CARY|nr:hypothetical protein Cgig2_030883 [Carnegiea gigantea]
MKYMKTCQYIVKEFKKEHNHQLVPPQQVNLIRAFRGIDDVTKIQATYHPHVDVDKLDDDTLVKIKQQMDALEETLFSELPDVGNLFRHMLQKFAEKNIVVSTSRGIGFVIGPAVGGLFAMFWCTIGARAEIDIVSDYGVNSENPPQQNEQNCTAGYVTNMHEQEATRLISNQTISNYNVKKPNTLQNILMEAEIGKPRESMSSMHNNHARVVQRGKIEVSAKVLKPTIIPSIIKPAADSLAIVRVKACADSVRVHASPSLEHQVLD